MELQIVGTNTKVGPSVRRHIESKLGKLNRHLTNIMDTKVEVSEEKLSRHSSITWCGPLFPAVRRFSTGRRGAKTSLPRLTAWPK